MMGSCLMHCKICKVLHLCSLFYRLFPLSVLAPFFRCEIRASGIVVFRLFLSYVICLIVSIVFFRSNFFSSINFSRSLVSIIAVMNYETRRSSAVFPSNVHSFSIFISLRQKSSGVLVLFCLVQKNSPRL